MPVPDIAAFDAAQRRLREYLGQDVTFLIPAVDTHEGVVDPETDAPYDPWATPESSTDPEQVTLRVGLVNRPLARTGLGDDVEMGPVGAAPTENIAFILNPEQYTQVSAATRAIVFGETYTITDWRPDGYDDLLRWLAYGTRG